MAWISAKSSDVIAKVQADVTSLMREPKNGDRGGPRNTRKIKMERLFSRNDAVEIQRKGAKTQRRKDAKTQRRKDAKTQRRKVDTAIPESEWLAACAHQKVTLKTDNNVLQNPCAFAPLRLGVKSLRHGYGSGDPEALTSRVKCRSSIPLVLFRVISPVSWFQLLFPGLRRGGRTISRGSTNSKPMKLVSRESVLAEARTFCSLFTV